MFEVGESNRLEFKREFKDLKIVEHLGSGMRRILKEYDASIFNFLGNFLKVSFAFNEKVKKDKNDTVNDTENDTVKEDEILRLIKISNKISARRIAKETEYSIATVKRYMTKLKEKGKLKRIGPDKGGYWEMRNAN